jgi:hypothetical protein
MQSHSIKRCNTTDLAIEERRLRVLLAGIEKEYQIGLLQACKTQEGSDAYKQKVSALAVIKCRLEKTRREADAISAAITGQNGGSAEFGAYVDSVKLDIRAWKTGTVAPASPVSDTGAEDDMQRRFAELKRK